MGIKVNCMVLKNTTTRIVLARRGSSSVVGSCGTDSSSVDGCNEYSKVLLCEKKIEIVFHCDGSEVNAVMNPVEASGCVVLAEFCLCDRKLFLFVYALFSVSAPYKI